MIRQATVMDVDVLRSLSIDTFTQTFGHLYTPEDLTAFIEQTYSHAALSALLQDPTYRFWLMYADETAETPTGYALAGPCSLPHDKSAMKTVRLRDYISATNIKAVGAEPL